MSDIQVRPFRRGDRDQLTHLVNAHAEAVVPGMSASVSRSVGIRGCRLSAVLGAEVIGYIETEILDEGERMWRHGGWADVGNLRVAAPYRRRGVGSWLPAIMKAHSSRGGHGGDQAGVVVRGDRAQVQEQPPLLQAAITAAPEYCVLPRVGGGQYRPARQGSLLTGSDRNGWDAADAAQ